MPSPHQPTSLQSAKRELRRMMEAKRQEAAQQIPDAARNLRNNCLKTFSFPRGSIIASYHARGSEMNPQLLSDALRAQGHSIALPVMNGKKAPLVFRTYTPGDTLAPGHFGLLEPLATAPAVEPDILLVPLLAYDRHKGRLGYGGGYYDRTLAHLRQRKTIIAIGIGYSVQEIAEIPMGSYDVRLDKVATELQVL